MKKYITCLFITALAVFSPLTAVLASDAPEESVTADQAAAYANGLQKIGGKWYFFKSGKLQTGWQKIDGKTRYFDPDNSGVMLTGLQNIDGKWYYLKSGILRTGWQTTAPGKTRYFDKTGAMVTGLTVIEDNMYLFLSSGALSQSYGPVSASSAGSLAAAKDTDQILTVAVSGTSADVALHLRDSAGVWHELLRTDGTIGVNGLGKTKEGDRKTPVGLFHFTEAFGINSDPGSVIPYTQVDNTYYWVGDSDSQYYNQFVSTAAVTKDWDDAEHIIDYPVVYNYVLALDYNSSYTPGLGSAIFLHCWRNGGTTLGCVAVPESAMTRIMGVVDRECAVIIDTAENIQNY